MKLPLGKIRALQAELNAHPLLNNNIIKDLNGLHIFMEHHVFAVWDFMSLIKGLQHYICPSTTCWIPRQKIRSGSARLVNQIVLAEETDIDMDGTSTISHHDLYCQAMLEVGADANLIEEWTEAVEHMGFHGALENCVVPPAASEFMQSTFKFIDTAESHVIAAAFCFGREDIIPQMFTNLTSQISITQQDCPKFFYYLQRHIDLDGDDHGPKAVALVEDLCDHDPVHIHEAEQAALAAIKARIKFWDNVQHILEHNAKDWKHG
jgi:hypothetical protein